MSGLPESAPRMPYWRRGGRLQAACTANAPGACIVRRTHTDPDEAEGRR